MQRWAERGAALDDIVMGLGIPVAVADAQRDRLRSIVEAGNARFRLNLARRAEREGVQKGRATVLIAACKKHLGWDKTPADLPPPEADLLQQLEAALDKAQEARQARERETAAAPAEQPPGKPA